MAAGFVAHGTSKCVRGIQKRYLVPFQIYHLVTLFYIVWIPEKCKIPGMTKKVTLQKYITYRFCRNPPRSTLRGTWSWKTELSTLKQSNLKNC